MTLDVKEFGSEKTVTVSDFTFTYQIMFYETTPVPTTYRNYLYESIQKSLKRELEQKLNYTFDLDKRVEINPKMVKELMQTVFQVTAQDF